MGNYVQHITYKGKEIAFLDTRGVDEKEAIAAWEEMKRDILTRQGIHLTLIDGTDVSITPAMLRKVKEASANVKDPDSLGVFVGLTPLQRSTAELIARGMHLKLHFCQTLEEGKEWLAREDDKRHRR